MDILSLFEFMCFGSWPGINLLISHGADLLIKSLAHASVYQLLPSHDYALQPHGSSSEPSSV